MYTFPVVSMPYVDYVVPARSEAKTYFPLLVNIFSMMAYVKISEPQIVEETGDNTIYRVSFWPTRQEKTAHES